MRGEAHVSPLDGMPVGPNLTESDPTSQDRSRPAALTPPSVSGMGEFNALGTGSAMTLTAFVVACALLSLAPGPSIAMVIRETLSGGRRNGLAAAVGTETGILGWSIAAALGLSVLVAVSQVAYDVIRTAGAAVLLFLGAQALWAARHPESDEAEPLAGRPSGPRSAWSSFRVGLATIAANPKGAVFSSSFLPQFVPHGAPVLPWMLALGMVWALIDGSWCVVVACGVARARRMFTRARVKQRLEQLTGVVLIALGVRLATEGR
jgi:threonine/homoserine/homoserine lactone efflux protein